MWSPPCNGRGGFGSQTTTDLAESSQNHPLAITLCGTAAAALSRRDRSLRTRPHKRVTMIMEATIKIKHFRRGAPSNGGRQSRKSLKILPGSSGPESQNSPEKSPKCTASCSATLWIGEFCHFSTFSGVFFRVRAGRPGKTSNSRLFLQQEKGT